MICTITTLPPIGYVSDYTKNKRKSSYMYCWLIVLNKYSTYAYTYIVFYICPNR